MPDGGYGVSDESFVPGPATARVFRDALGRFATGITVVTAGGDAGPVGLTANSFASVSLDPALVLWSPAKSSSRFERFMSARQYAIHVLAADQHALCRHFVRPGASFELPGIAFSDAGTPLLAGCLARFECEQVAAHDAGDHAIIVGRVLRASLRQGEPLVFSAGRYGRFLPEG
ncbi:flavin reductase family protein [Plastorhodobacter daqingensis]|uniref:Flavin reductase family protein n=1 Tax=Plastorhodobacter daqingensis TaxID=1387281 RepID=A0ABW2UK40_9RHOB